MYQSFGKIAVGWLLSVTLVVTAFGSPYSSSCCCQAKQKAAPSPDTESCSCCYTETLPTESSCCSQNAKATSNSCCSEFGHDSDNSRTCQSDCCQTHRSQPKMVITDRGRDLSVNYSTLFALESTTVESDLTISALALKLTRARTPAPSIQSMLCVWLN